MNSGLENIVIPQPTIIHYQIVLNSSAREFWIGFGLYASVKNLLSISDLRGIKFVVTGIKHASPSCNIPRY